MTASYALITPAHNEARFLPVVIDHVMAQTAPPARWIIVDDRSTDDTWPVLEAQARKHPSILPVRRTGDQARRVGANVVHVFNHGLEHLDREVEFIVKMDADLVLPRSYYEELLAEFAREPRLGVASGKIFCVLGGRWVRERYPDFHVPGACKMYRRTCYDAIGGQMPVLGWDILDVTKARSLGWITRSYRRLPMYHLRQTGSAQGVGRTHETYGHCVWSMRAHPLFVLGRSLYRALERPYGSGLFILWGYLKAAWNREKRLDDWDLIRFLRKEQLGRLLGRTAGQEEIFARALDDDLVDVSGLDLDALASLVEFK
jgi:glycosyltransferase involved in cell wall biosynthesis